MNTDNCNCAIEILLVEDDPADVELARETLQSSKLQLNLNVVEDGLSALDYLHQRGDYTAADSPDLVLLDLNLPGLSGREVLREVKADDDLCHIPIVVLTTSDADEDILRSYVLGANCYVKKPVGLDEFVRIVQTLEEFWFTVVKLPPRTIR